MATATERFLHSQKDSASFAREPVRLVLGSCIETTYAKNAGGYGVRRVNGVLHRHHRLVYAKAHGISIDSLRGSEVMHLCDNPACINPLHLALGTHTDNMHDMFSKGRRTAAVGEQNGRSKLTSSEVLEIRHSHGTNREIAARFGIANSQVSLIKRRKIWKHL